jgi:hypothetical protein
VLADRLPPAGPRPVPGGPSPEHPLNSASKYNSDCLFFIFPMLSFT